MYYGHCTMYTMKATIWIRKEHEDLWKDVEKKSELVAWALELLKKKKGYSPEPKNVKTDWGA